jgi:predicted HicB family RNase H-like nuclease
MSDVTVELDDDVFALLVEAAEESGLSVNDFANKLLKNYLEDNYGAV